MLAALPDSHHTALGVLLGLGVGAFITHRLRLPFPARIGMAYGEATLVALAVSLTGGATSPLLPYLLAPGLALGLLSGPRAVLQGSFVMACWLLIGRFGGRGSDRLPVFAAAAVQWVLLSAAIGLVAAWARTLTSGPVREDSYSRARDLLEQLRTVTRGLPGGLDAPTAAESLLAAATALAPASRSAVLAQTSQGGALVPLAVHGTRRVPWRTPLSESGPLQRAWRTQQPVVDRRHADKRGRRRGNVLAVFPLASGSGPFGLLILESLEPDAFPDSVLSAIVERVRESALRLETALLFSEVRAAASMEERDRLAREMHDGVAQDLAFLGYRLDELRGQAAKVDGHLAAAVTDLRTEVTELIANLRLSITDLKTSVSADRGLGSALSSYVRAIGSGHQLTVHLSLQESPFRLPADHEVALFRVAQAVAQDVRRTGRAGNLWVTLSVDPPSARLLVEHDGPIGQGSTKGLGLLADDLARVGGHLEVHDRRGGGVRVEAVLEGADDGADPAGRRPRADPAGAAPSLRGD